MFQKFSIKSTAAIIFFLAIGGYAYSNSKDVISAPEIIIATPANGATLDSPNLRITGQALRVNNLFLNGRPISLDKAGYFSEELLLAYGYNLIDLRAAGKFGGQTKKTLELVLK